MGGCEQSSDRPTVEQALRLEIDQLMRCRVIRPGEHLAGEMRLEFYDDDLMVKFEARARDPWDSWVRLRYSVSDYLTGEDVEIDDKVRLTTTRPNFGGHRWWFVCPCTNMRCRLLLLPLGGRHFLSRRAYELGYACQREREHDRALRRVRKLRLRLGGDPADDERPEKPSRMRWTTYNRLIAELEAAERVADQAAHHRLIFGPERQQRGAGRHRG